ncbi:Wzz/FepE/Etk N-terminal domain-containing protein, partial [bacterium]|nr:Wzz/FepE/Etk N-terminal domain-containing protein [bacterium]
MPNSPEQSQAYNDEIDLADLIRALWQGKWLVIGVTLVTLALGIAYLMIAPKSYTASLNIWALPDSQADVYIELHEAEIITADKKLLLTLFVEDLKTQTQSGNGLGLSIASVTPTQSRLSFPTQAPGQLTDKVADALDLANQNVNQRLELNFSRQSDKLAKNNKTAIEALNLERLEKITLFKANQNQQIAVLENRVRISRANYDASIKKEISLLQQQISISRANYDASIKKEISLLQQQVSIALTNYD